MLKTMEAMMAEIIILQRSFVEMVMAKMSLGKMTIVMAMRIVERTQTVAVIQAKEKTRFTLHHGHLISINHYQMNLINILGEQIKSLLIILKITTIILTSENNNNKKNYGTQNQDESEEEMPSVEERAKARKEEKGE
jgi:hypothetical protein